MSQFHNFLCTTGFVLGKRLTSNTSMQIQARGGSGVELPGAVGLILNVTCLFHPPPTATNVLQSKRFMHALTSKLCAEVWRTGYDFSLNPGTRIRSSKWKLRSFPRILISIFAGKVRVFKLSLQTSDQIFCFRF